MENRGWDFHSAFSTAAGVIPTLLLALILEKQLLPVAVTFLSGLRYELEHPPRWVKFIRALSPGSVPTSIRLLRPSWLILLTVLAEMVALFGVAMPSAWSEHGPGKFLTFVGLGFVGWVIFSLLNMIALALVVVAVTAETKAETEHPGDESAGGGSHAQ